MKTTILLSIISALILTACEVAEEPEKPVGYWELTPKGPVFVPRTILDDYPHMYVCQDPRTCT